MRCYRNWALRIGSLVIAVMVLLGVVDWNVVHADGFFPRNSKLSFERIDREHGLSNLSVSSILQDRDGFIWFGTQGGLNRFDGEEMKVLRNDPFSEDGLQHNLIQTLTYDEEEHDIWIGTYQGLSRYDIENNRFTNYTMENSDLSDPVIIAILKDQSGSIWFGTMKGLNRLDIKTQRITNFSVAGDVVRDLHQDEEGTLWVATHHGLGYFDKDTQQVQLMNLDLPSPYVMTLDEFRTDVLTLGLWDGGVVHYHRQTSEIEHIELTDNRVYTVNQTDDGSLWAGTWGGGLYSFGANGEQAHYSGDDVHDGLQHAVIYSIFQDSSGILWVGTNGGGVFKVNPRKTDYVVLQHNSDEPDSLRQGKINKIIGGYYGELWIALYNNGLERYDPGNQQVRHYLQPTDTNNTGTQIVDMVELDSDTLLLGLETGLHNFNKITGAITPWQDGVLPYRIYAIEPINEQEYWVGTYENGLYYINTSTNHIQQYSKDSTVPLARISDNLIYDILYDSKNRLWVGTNNGLNLLTDDDERFQVYSKKDGNQQMLSSNTIKVIFEDSNQRIWIGTVGGGIMLYDEDQDQFVSYIESNGLADNTVAGILEGNDQRIWVSTHNGISVIDPDTGEIFNLTPDDGIGGWEFNTGHYRDIAGYLHFGGIHGITRIPDDYSSPTTPPPRIYITDVQVFHESIDSERVHFNDAHLMFEPNENFIGFEFSALEYETPDRIQYSYRLVGIDDDWIQAGTHDHVYYSNLAPGNYEIQLKAKTAKNVETETVSIWFTVKPPWYNSTLAYIGYALIALIVIMIIFKFRETQLTNQRNAELFEINQKLQMSNLELIQEAEMRKEAEQTAGRMEAYVRNQQKLESIGILAGGVAHEINNPINGIMNYSQLIVDTVETDSDIQTYAQEIIHETDRVSTIVKNLLKFSRQENAQFSPAVVDEIVGQTVTLIRTILSKDQISLEIQIAEGLPAIECRSQQLQQVLLNLITNARDSLNEKYTGYHEDKVIRVECKEITKKGSPWLQIMVEDHGKGIPRNIEDNIFDPFFTTKDRYQGTGLGLSISHGIVQDHDGELHFDSQENIYTRFYMEIPFHR